MEEVKRTISIPEARLRVSCDTGDMLECFTKGKIKVGNKGFVFAVFNDPDAAIMWNLLGGTAYKMSEPLLIGENSYIYAAVDYYNTLKTAEFEPHHLFFYPNSASGVDVFPFPDCEESKTFAKYSPTLRRKNALWRQFSFTLSLVKWFRKDIFAEYNIDPEEFLINYPFPDLKLDGTGLSSLFYSVFGNISNASQDSSKYSGFINLAILNRLLKNFTGKNKFIQIFDNNRTGWLHFGFLRGYINMSRYLSYWLNTVNEIFPLSQSHDFIKNFGYIEYVNLLYLLKIYIPYFWEMEGNEKTEYDNILENIKLRMIYLIEEFNVPETGGESSEECYNSRKKFFD